MKKLISLVLALAMILLCVGTAIAEDPTTGSITVEKNYKGQDYTLYKLFDAQISWASDGTVQAVNYVLPSGKTSADLEDENGKQWFKVNDLGFIEVIDDSVTTDWAKDPDAKNWARRFGTIVGNTLTAASDNDANIKWTGLTFGYYLVDSTMGAYVSVDTTNPNQIINDKNNPPSIDKDIKSVTNGSVDDGGDNAIAQVGDTIEYKLTVHAKPGAENYEVCDTISAGLTAPAAANVTVTGLTVTDDYTVEVNPLTGDDAGKHAIVVTFTKAYLDSITSDTLIEIAYSCILNENAVIGSAGNPNTVTLKWGHKQDNETVPMTVKVYSAEISVVKHDGNSNPLSGAEFALKNSNGEYYHLKDDGAVEWIANVANATKYTSDAATGALSGAFTGLTKGDYALVETIVPNGYNKVADDDPSLTFTIEGDEYTDANLIQSTTVINNAGAVLPGTGGMGTTIFYVVGGILLVGAAIVLVARRKANN